MEITGKDYMYLTNLKPEKVESLFFVKLREYWPSPLIEAFDRTSELIELFIAKNEAMNHFHEEHGFALNENGEGCFMFYANHAPLLQSDIQKSNIYLLGVRQNVEPHPAELILIDTWEYTLVLPASIEESKFAMRIHEYLTAAISEAARAELVK